MSYHVSGPGKATNNSVKQRAHSFISETVTKEYFNNEWKNKTKNYSVWNENGKFIGFALTKNVKNKELEISLIGTNKGKGIGAMLMKKIITLAKRRKYKKITLDSVSSAFKFYTKFGFKLDRGNNNHLEMSLNLSSRPRYSLRSGVK